MSQELTLKNTPHSYGLIAIWLHWIVAAAFIANYAICLLYTSDAADE